MADGSSAKRSAWIAGLIAAVVFIGIQVTLEERLAMSDVVMALVVAIATGIAIHLYERTRGSRRNPSD